MHKRREKLPNSLTELEDHKFYGVSAVQEVFGASRAMVRKFCDLDLLHRVDPKIVGTRLLFTGGELKRFAALLAGPSPTPTLT